MSKRVLCKFFAHGTCLKGEHCEFSHDWRDPANNVCTYFQKGVCSYGSRCRYEHVRVSRLRPSAPYSSTDSHHSLVSNSGSLGHPSRTSSTAVAVSNPLMTSTKPAWRQDSSHHDLSDGDDVGQPSFVRPVDQPICSFAAAGNCPRGDKCPHMHGEECPTCGKQCLHPFRPDEREEHLRTCKKRQKQLDALKHSQEIECSVCLERVLSKPSPAEQKFGLLSECDHPFCISCIRNWRSSSPATGMDVNTALRACPICRKLSYFVIPSVIWYTTKEEKDEIVGSYKAKLRSIDCKYFDFGNGACPFGTSCFYKYNVKPGSYTWNYLRSPHRHRSNMLDMVHMLDFLDFLETYSEMVDELENFDGDDIGSQVLTLEDFSLLTALGHDIGALTNLEMAILLRQFLNEDDLFDDDDEEEEDDDDDDNDANDDDDDES